MTNGEGMETLDLALRFLESLTGVASVFIAFFLFRLGNKQRSDSWFQSFNQLHHTFWEDEDFEKARAMIANDESYRRLEAVLEKRFKPRPSLSRRIQTT